MITLEFEHAFLCNNISVCESWHLEIKNGCSVSVLRGYISPVNNLIFLKFYMLHHDFSILTLCPDWGSFPVSRKTNNPPELFFFLRNKTLHVFLIHEPSGTISVWYKFYVSLFDWKVLKLDKKKIKILLVWIVVVFFFQFYYSRMSS